MSSLRQRAKDCVTGAAPAVAEGEEMKRIPKRPKLADLGERDILMERAAGFVALWNGGRISKAAAFAGFLALMNPEMSTDRRAELAREMAKEE